MNGITRPCLNCGGSGIGQDGGRLFEARMGMSWPKKKRLEKKKCLLDTNVKLD